MIIWAEGTSNFGHVMSLIRYDVVQFNHEWVISTGGVNESTYVLRSEAVDAAIADARSRQRSGDQVVIYLWSDSAPTLIYGGDNGAEATTKVP